ncbi:MAG: hypothetical protein IJT96_10830 [Lachnospiraceae bacterium]|nr:hypothetical protein [Lachnospiraceae bacterium]
MDNTERKLKKLFDYQKFEKEPGLQELVDDVHGSLSGMRKLTDDELEYAAAGAARFSDSQLEKAGVNIKYVNGKKTYQATLSGGKSININENVAMGMYDCYNLSGGTKLTDAQLKDLIAQS